MDVHQMETMCRVQTQDQLIKVKVAADNLCPKLCQVNISYMC